MLKIDKNAWIVYNNNGALVTIEVYNRDDDRNILKLKGFERASILDDSFDNADYCLRWDVWENKSNMTNEQIKENIDKKLNLKDYLTVKYRASIFNRLLKNYLIVSGQLLETSHNDQVIDFVYNTICSHFDKNAICWQYKYNSSGYTYCSREQAKQVLKTFEKLEVSKNEINKENERNYEI